MWFPGARECCYSRHTRRLLTGKNARSGSSLLYNPLFQFENYIKHDKEAKYHCCAKSNLCSVYYALRPETTCRWYRPPWRGWMSGDPHITTLDRHSYTFNGLGEYWLVKTPNISIQARTAQAKNSAGDLVKATVFSAVSVKDQDAPRMHIQMNSARTGVEIYLDDVNITSWFYSGQHSYQTPEIILTRENDSLVAAFPSGVSTTLTLKAGQLDIVVSMPQSFHNSTSGLMGVFNNNPDDDFTLPNGTVLSKSATERQIYYEFGERWRISESESILWYAPGESVNTYRGENFTPMFEVQFPDDVTKQKAEKMCTDQNGKLDTQCLYDYSSTGNAELAANTMTSQNANNKEADEIAALPPEVTGPVTINAIVGEQVEFTVHGSDGNGDRISFVARELPPGAIFMETATNATFRWTPRNLEPVQLRFYALDSTNQSSPDHEVSVKLCDCSGNGDCDFNDPADEQPIGAMNFELVSCNCSAGWEGDKCEENFDACNESPCTPGSNCTDLTPEEEQRRGVGYNCTSCPDGYETLENRCIDIDECEQNSSVPACEHVCANSPGSYHCECNTGFNLVDSTQCQDIDECSRGTAGCHHVCVNTEGGFICRCHDGYRLNSDNRSCSQESSTASLCSGVGCEYGCRPKSGQSGVECFCKMGYQLQTDAKHCTDVDECVSASHTCGNYSRCVNTEGGYTCQCEDGFSLQEDQRSCQACDENRWGPNCANLCSCPYDSKCDKVKGCESCPTGYKGSDCNEDIDECAQNPSRCGSGANCVNEIGSFKCECKDGFIPKNGKCEACASGFWGRGCLLECNCLEGSTCDPSNGCSACAEGFQGASCGEDIDECNTTSAGAQCRASGGTCVNSQGSYLCQCADKPLISDGVCIVTLPSTPMLPTDICWGRTCSTRGSCSNDGRVWYCHCSDGFTGRECQIGDIGQRRAMKIRGQLVFNGLQFSDALNDPQTTEYKDVEKKSEQVIDLLFSDSYGDSYHGTQITNFRSGSVVVSFVLLLNPDLKIADLNDTSSITRALQKYTALGVLLLKQLAIDPNQTVLYDYNECVGSSQPCENGGQCANLKPGFICTCPFGYSGTNCENGPLVIIAGVVGGVLLLLVLVTIIIIAKRKSCTRERHICKNASPGWSTNLLLDEDKNRPSSAESFGSKPRRPSSASTDSSLAVDSDGRRLAWTTK